MRQACEPLQGSQLTEQASHPHPSLTSWKVGSCSSMTLNMLARMSKMEGSWERSVRRSTVRLPQV